MSARSRLKGTIIEVRKGATTAHVRLDIGGAIVTSSITNEPVDGPGPFTLQVRDAPSPEIAIVITPIE
ncbi:MAG: TOBE domain-containing protein [Hyphomicrobiales bacterium]|nr:TOBE domain-containing protein [Hyphomicrobiales bacterium]